MANAKRVLLLVTQADWGGVQAFLIRFGAYLKKQGITVMLAAGGEGRLWEEAKKAGIPAKELRHMEREISPMHDIAAVAELRELIKDFKPDAVHLNSTKMGILGSIACALSAPRPRTVYRIGGWVFLEPLPSWKKWLYRSAEKLTAGYKDIIITVHPGDEALARRLGIKPRQAIVTVSNGLSEDFATDLLPKDAARTALGMPQDAFVFGTVANAYATKGLPEYLDALKTILGKDPLRHAVIIGGGPELDAVRAKRDALDLTDRVTLTGQRGDASLLYRAFDAFVLPSKKEGMPWTLLEAMAAGVPCVATDVGACPWMLNDSEHPAGIIVPPNDKEALIAALEQISADQQKREALGRNGTWLVTNVFTWNKTAQGNQDTLSI